MTSRIAPELRTKRCNQCRRERPINCFALKPKGGRMQDCATCRKKYRGWNKLTLAQKVATIPRRRDGAPRGFVLFKRVSTNRKLGGIPMSISERGTCPSSCSFFQAGCFADYGYPGVVWRKVGARRMSSGRRGMSWDAFLAAVRAMPKGTLWRHNVAGDLPGAGSAIDTDMLWGLVEANAGRRGFTFTHKHTFDFQRDAIAGCNIGGFTVNMSADSLEQADELAALGIGPVVAVVPHDAPLRLKTPAGRRVVICPAETDANLTCRQCELCAVPNRKAIVGFRAHGQFKALVTELVRDRRGAA